MLDPNIFIHSATVSHVPSPNILLRFSLATLSQRNSAQDVHTNNDYFVYFSDFIKRQLVLLILPLFV